MYKFITSCIMLIISYFLMKNFIDSNEKIYTESKNLKKTTSSEFNEDDYKYLFIEESSQKNENT